MEEEEKLVCAEKCPHLNKINNVKSLEAKADQYQKLSNMFKLFSDETRLKIICSLLKEELCVCDRIKSITSFSSVTTFKK